MKNIFVGKSRTCEIPFELVPGIGCLFIYSKAGNTFVEGQEKCASLGADVFEFQDIDHQIFPFKQYLVSRNCKLFSICNVVLNVYNFTSCILK